MKRTWLLTFGLIIVGVSVFLTLHGARAAVSHALYHRAKYGKASGDLQQVLALCERAHRLYPYNFYVCMLAGEQAYYAGANGDTASARELFARARPWCETGLQLNYYRSQLRILKVRLLERENIAKAVEFLEEFLDWNYWMPGNHLEMVRLCAKSGDYDKALTSLNVLKGREYHAEASAILKDAWLREKASRPVVDMRKKPAKP